MVRIVNISARLTAVFGLKYEDSLGYMGARSAMYEITRTRRWPRRRRATLCTSVQHGSWTIVSSATLYLGGKALTTS